MNHLQTYQAREVICLPTAEIDGWRLKRYAIRSENRTVDENIILAALDAAIMRLPQSEKLENSDNNHGIGFQIIHFAEVAVVSPIFYWIWGSVLANTLQMRAQWDTPTKFEDGVKEVLGCIWELEIVAFEARSWKEIMLNEVDAPQQRLLSYLNCHYDARSSAFEE